MRYIILKLTIKQGVIDEQGAQIFINNNQCLDTDRAGKIWFIFGVSHLKDLISVQRMFKHWGGEALYNSHEKKASGELLRNIGEPCIVKAQIMVSHFKFYYMDNFITAYLKSRCVNKINDFDISDIPHSFSNYIERNLPPNQILEIITYGDRFFCLTSYRENSLEMVV